MKRIIAALLVFCCLLGMLPLQAYAYPAAKKLPALTGDQAKDTAAIAASQLGYAESNGTVYGAWWEGQVTWEYDYTHADWCGMFAAWCAYQAGAGMGKAYDNTAALANGLFQWLKDHAHYDITFHTNPRPGDFIFFAEDNDGLADHVAVVTGYQESTKTVTFVGGNQDGGRVTQVSCKWAADGTYGNQVVLGYGRPNYKTASLTYLERCVRYPSYRELRTDCETDLYSQPGTVADHSGSKKLATLSAGTKLIAVGLYRNPGGGCWYEVSYQNVVCYVYAADVSTKAALYSDLTLTDLEAPVTVKEKTAFYIGGILRTVHNTIFSVTAEIKRPGNTIYSGTDEAQTVQYSLRYSPVDDALPFTKLACGDYLFSLSATIHNYYSKDGQTVRYDSYTKLLNNSAFRVSATGKERPTAYTVTFDPNGGEGGPTMKIYQYGSVFGAMPVPERKGYIFMGWYTAMKGGTEMSSSHQVGGSRTLYAHWQCDHVWETVSHQEGSCTVDTVTVSRCGTCGEEKNVTEQAPGHDWELTEHTEADCTTDEVKAYTCYRCGEFRQEVITKAPGHVWKEEWRTEAGCTTDEAVSEFCTVCFAERMTVGETAWGHDWDGLTCRTCGAYMDNPFADVAKGQYYHDSVLWAYHSGITAGMDATHFGPDVVCTRAQVVTFLWRASGCPQPKQTRQPFTDVSSSAYYAKAVAWAVEQGITAGMDETHFGPDVPCTRAHVATFLWRAEGSPEAKGETIFRDLEENSFYYEAVLWAVERGITKGVDEQLFAPSMHCTRAQIVSFLQRTYG